MPSKTTETGEDATENPAPAQPEPAATAKTPGYNQATGEFVP